MPAGAGAPFFWGAIAGSAGAIGSAAIGSRSASNSARVQSETATRAAEIEARAAAEALAFEKERESRRRKEFDDIQARNFEQYQLAQGRLAPYRALGRGSIGLLARPLPGRPQPGSIGALIGVK